MGSESARPLPPMEVKRDHHVSRRGEEPSPSLPERAMHMAKAKAGAAVREAIGERRLKEFGHEGLVSAVCSGEKVPDYLARIVDDPAARRRFALALLEGDTEVEIETVVRIKRTA